MSPPVISGPFFSYFGGFQFLFSRQRAYIPVDFESEVSANVGHDFHNFRQGRVFFETETVAVGAEVAQAVAEADVEASFESGEYFGDSHLTEDQFASSPSGNILHIRHFQICPTVFAIIDELFVRSEDDTFFEVVEIDSHAAFEKDGADFGVFRIGGDVKLCSEGCDLESVGFDDERAFFVGLNFEAGLSDEKYAPAVFAELLRVEQGAPGVDLHLCAVGKGDGAHLGVGDMLLHKIDFRSVFKMQGDCKRGGDKKQDCGGHREEEAESAGFRFLLHAATGAPSAEFFVDVTFARMAEGFEVEFFQCPVFFFTMIFAHKIAPEAHFGLLGVVVFDEKGNDFPGIGFLVHSFGAFSVHI